MERISNAILSTQFYSVSPKLHSNLYQTQLILARIYWLFKISKWFRFVNIRTRKDESLSEMFHLFLKLSSVWVVVLRRKKYAAQNCRTCSPAGGMQYSSDKHSYNSFSYKDSVFDRGGKGMYISQSPGMRGIWMPRLKSNI